MIDKDKGSAASGGAQGYDMRLPAILLTGLVAAATALPIAEAAAMGAVPLAPAMPGPTVLDRGITRVEYFCSPGFEVSGSRCVAVASRDEIDLALNPTFGDAPPRHHRRHRYRHGLRERY